jgi:hypothetical protein
MLYGIKCWAINKQHVHKMSVAIMIMLKWISRNTRRDQIQNEEIRLKIRTTFVEENISESCLR